MEQLIYPEITHEQRENVSLAQITQMTDVQQRTINHYYRQTRRCQQFEMEIIKDYFQLFVQDYDLLNLTFNQLRSFIKKKIKHEFLYETSHYQEFLDKIKQSNRQRMLNKVVQEISTRIFKKKNIILGDDCLNSKIVDDQQKDNYDFDFEQYKTQDNHLEQKDLDIQESQQFSQNYFY